MLWKTFLKISKIIIDNNKHKVYNGIINKEIITMNQQLKDILGAILFGVAIGSIFFFA